jgi:CRP/FNR family cyclic AMP-dependent transcriptional regulator
VSVLEPTNREPVAAPQASGRRSAPLLDLDPDLGRVLPAAQWDAARRDVAVRVMRLRRGPWPVEPLAGVNASHLGLLVTDGILGRELLADDVASLELLGPGDLLRPWDEADDARLLRAVVRWNAFSDARLAILDRQVAVRLAQYPELYSALLERCTARSRRLAVMQAICQINRVDRRVLTLLWHLAERWGKVTAAGVVVPLTLSHRMLAQLIGARRPTVSTALGELRRAGELARAADGTWILSGAPVGMPAAGASRFVAPRRAMLAAHTT